MGMMVPQEELPILESLVNLKHRLGALKKDTTTFIRAKDVMSIYQSVAREVTKLNAVRDRANQSGMLSSSSAVVDSSSSSNLNSSSEDGGLGMGTPGGTSRRNSRTPSAAGGGGAGNRGPASIPHASTNRREESEKEGLEGLGRQPGSINPRQGFNERSVSTDSYTSASSATVSAAGGGGGAGDGDGSGSVTDPSAPSSAGSSRRPSAVNTPNFEGEQPILGMHNHHHHLDGELDALQRGHPGLAGRMGSGLSAASPSAPISPSSRSPQPNHHDGQNPFDADHHAHNEDTSSLPTPKPIFNLPSLASTSSSPSPQSPLATSPPRSSPPLTTTDTDPPPHLATVDVKPPTESNRVDQVLNDVFGLLSLFFLTIGKVRESPGTFCQIASMRQLLDHMNESGVYLQSDLQQFRSRLDVLKAIIKRDREEGKHPDAIIKLMMRKLEDTERLLQTLLKSLSILSVELVPIHQRLVHIRRQLAALSATQLKVPKAEIKPLVEELRKIDSSRVDGKFLGPGGSSVPTGQAILVGLLEESFEICQDIRARDGEENVAPPLKPIWERLTDIRSKLERLQLTHRWTLRETDLYNYSQALREVDAMRVDGSFVDLEGNKAEGQYVLLYLLRRCHGLIYRLIAESEPISEELMPIANKLSTVKKCLNEVLKYGGPFSTRDLYPYHLALHQIDTLRVDGKFLSEDGSIPEGQAILVAQLSEAHEILEMLKEGMGSEEEDEDDEDEEYEEDDDDDAEVEAEKKRWDNDAAEEVRVEEERVYKEKYGKREGDRSEMQVTRQESLGGGVGASQQGMKSDLRGVIGAQGGEGEDERVSKSALPSDGMAAPASVSVGSGSTIERGVEGIKLE